ITVDVVIGGNGWFVLALGLHAQHDDDISPFNSFLDFVHAASGSARRDFFQFARNPHRGPAKRKAATELAEQMNVRAGDAGVRKIAEDRDVEIFDRALAVANGERIEQSL